jgi:hypothetical protein
MLKLTNLPSHVRDPEVCQMVVLSRIEIGSTCAVIDLWEAERAIFSGAGWRLARFEDARLVELFDPSGLPFSDDMQDLTEAAACAASAWLASAAGETFLVLCCGSQLLMPRPIALGDPASLRYMSRLLASEVSPF